MKRFVKKNVGALIFALAVIILLVLYMLWASDEFAEIVGQISGFVSIVTVVPAVAAWISAQRIASRLEGRAKSFSYEKNDGVALIINISATNAFGSIEKQVINDARKYVPEGIPFSNAAQFEDMINGSFRVSLSDEKLRILELQGRSMTIVEGEKESDYIADFKQILNDILERFRNSDGKVGTIHLYFKGPAVLAAIIGASVDNNFKTVLHHWSGGKYVVAAEISNEAL